MLVNFRLRNKTAAAWQSQNPRLAKGEPGVETDTHLMKVGDGATYWNDLGYVSGSAAATIAAHAAATTSVHGFDASGNAPPQAHNQSAATITSGTLDGDRLPALSTSKKGGVPATGTPSGKVLRDDGTWVAQSDGVTDHAALTGLAYGDSGHTGFAPTVHDHLTPWPSKTTTEMNALTPTEGMAVWNTTEHQLYVYDGSAWRGVPMQA